MTNPNSAEMVGEIFREAGSAFTKLSDLTMLLTPMGQSQPGGKWTEEEIEMLKICIHKFSIDINKISARIKNRTVSQIRTTLKKKAFEDAGLPLRQLPPALATSHTDQVFMEYLSTKRVVMLADTKATFVLRNVSMKIPLFLAQFVHFMKILTFDANFVCQYRVERRVIDVTF